MPEPNEYQDDEVDNLLQIDTEKSAPKGILRNGVLAQTIGVIRFRRRLKKGALAASLVACYFAGVATMGLRTPAQVVAPGTSNEQAAANQLPSQNSKSPTPAIVEDKPKPQDNPNKQAAPQPSREELLRREGDRLLANGDMKQAIRKYELALNLAPADRRAIAPEQDTWLLMALKNARSKEITHDRTQP
jgi:hypothetical protein